MERSNYEVGYKRPPRNTQFQPGQSGNPRGRPRHKKSFAELLNERLFHAVTLTENGAKRKMSLIEVIVHDVVHRAAKGDAKARRDLLELLKRYPRVARRQTGVRMITKDMSAKEAADLYAATLRDIAGLDDPNDFDPDDFNR